MDGRVATELLCELLLSIAARGETSDEIIGAACAMRARSQRVALPASVQAIDTCGTGGDGKPTFNVSTAAGIVAAAAGATVAKHGNRSHSRPSGSAEVLQALGVNVEADGPTLERCLRECRIAFLYAPRLHPAMRHAMEARRRIRERTIFNLLGPLTNPAGVRRQLVGVSRPEHVERIALALHGLGAERAMVVHGLCGVCDLTLDGATLVAKLDGAAIDVREIKATDCGLRDAPLKSIFVDSPQQSAEVIRAIMDNQPGPQRDTVVFNAAASLWVAGLAEDLEHGVAQSNQVLADGQAKRTLADWIRVSNESPVT